MSSGMDFYENSKARFNSIFGDLPKEQKDKLEKQLNAIDELIENDRGYMP